MTRLDPVIHLVNDQALLISFNHHPDTLAIQRLLLGLAQLLQARRVDGAASPEAQLQSIVPGPGSLMLELAPDTDLSLTTLTEYLEHCWKQLQADSAESPREVQIPVVYGGNSGPDLDQVAQHAGLSPEEVIQRHTAVQYDVLSLGFQPGFPYLHGLDPALHTPRRETPRTRIPAGSVAIGGAQTGIYPSASPGGWQIIGRSDTPLFDPGNERNPTLLLPGDRVRFVVEVHHV